MRRVGRDMTHIRPKITSNNNNLQEGLYITEKKSNHDLLRQHAAFLKTYAISPFFRSTKCIFRYINVIILLNDTYNVEQKHTKNLMRVEHSESQ